MREWNLKSGDPLELTLAADARLTQTDYNDDQIWELRLGGGEPPALALQTTFGLRARSLRLFPRFTEGDTSQTDPVTFPRPPVVHQFFPNYIKVQFTPFPDLDVEAEYWVPDSKSISGRVHLTNLSDRPRQIRFEWLAQLTPNDGQRMTPIEMQAAIALHGRTQDLAPVVFLTGGPQTGTGAYPSLRFDLELQPGGAHSIHWSQAGLSEPESSFNRARMVAARPWEAEIARLEMLNAGLIDIRTGNPDWDAAFALSQKMAFGLFVGPTKNLPAPSFVLSRQPDNGFSLRGDGSDYNHLWNGQSPLEAYYLSGLILPSSPDLAQGLVRNFLASQMEDGSIDWKPGLAGQRSRLLAMPILASLAWKIYQSTEDKSFLGEIFNGLLRFTQYWFAPEQDRDGDGIPEWSHPIQTGFEEQPLFSQWQPGAKGVEITTAESPALCALLYRECRSLIQIAGQLNRREPVAALSSLAEHVCTAIESSWGEEQASYQYWDRDTHHSTQGEKLAEGEGNGTLLIQRSFNEPVRLLIHILTQGETTRHPEIFIHGESAGGQPRLEHITMDQFKWHLGMGRLTGERVYGRIEQIEIQGIDPADQVAIYSVDYHTLDQTLLLPLWAKIPSAERAELLVHRTIASPQGFWRTFGLAGCPQPAHTHSAEGLERSFCQDVHLPWNTLIGEGLLEYGYQSEAAEIITRTMAAVTRSLKQEQAFRRYYHAETGQGSGEWNALSGLAPMGLFLDVLGVRLISSTKVALQRFNPFPWPVTVKFRGITILRHKESSMVIFPDGQTANIDDPAPRVVSLEAS